MARGWGTTTGRHNGLWGYYVRESGDLGIADLHRKGECKHRHKTPEQCVGKTRKQDNKNISQALPVPPKVHTFITMSVWGVMGEGGGACVSAWKGEVCHVWGML